MQHAERENLDHDTNLMPLLDNFLSPLASLYLTDTRQLISSCSHEASRHPSNDPSRPEDWIPDQIRSASKLRVINTIPAQDEQQGNALLSSKPSTQEHRLLLASLMLCRIRLDQDRRCTFRLTVK